MSDLISDPPTHELKVWPPYFDALISGVKTFEFRRDDREPRYAVGDVLWLREWGPDGGGIGSYSGSGRECYRRVTYVARDGVIPAGFCVMSIEPAPPSSSAEPAPPNRLGTCPHGTSYKRDCEDCGRIVPPLSPVQEEATPTASSRCPICGIDTPHSHSEWDVYVARVEEAQCRPEFENAYIGVRRGIWRDYLNNERWPLEGIGYESTREDARVFARFPNGEYQQRPLEILWTLYRSAWREVWELRGKEIAQLASRLSGSISERETLTARNAELQKMLEQERRAHGG